MTSCWRGCWIGFHDGLRSLKRNVYLSGRSHRRAHYNDAHCTVEFETLIEDEDFEPNPSRRVITDREKNLIEQRKYDLLVEQQRRHDREVDAQLKKEEEELRLEEEAYNEAKREASRAARQAKETAEKRAAQNKKYRGSLKTPDSISVSSWLSDDGLSLDSADLDAEDFDSFLEKVKARSLSSKQVESPVGSDSNGVIVNGWESSLAQSVEATKIAGKSYDAFKILDLSPPEFDDRATDVER